MRAIAQIKRRPATVRRFSLGDWLNGLEWITLNESSKLSGKLTAYIRRIMRQGKTKTESTALTRETFR